MISAMAGEYREGFKKVLDEIDPAALDRSADLLWQAWEKRRNVFIIGNGGSSSTAGHFACDLNKTAAIAGRKRFRAHCLSDNVPVLTAIGNDISYDQIFAEPLENFGEAGDVAVAFTVSGNSPNLLRAAEKARAMKISLIACSGFGGGKLKDLADVAIISASKDYGWVETQHVYLVHLWTAYLKKRVQASQ